MPQILAQLSLLVTDYDDAIDFYTNVLGFQLIEDTKLPDDGKRWVVVAPQSDVGDSNMCKILLAKATKPEQQKTVGKQSGGRVFLFLQTDNFWRDFELYKGRGVKFTRDPSDMPYGTVAVFEDLYGNLWDLIQYNE